MKVAINGFGRIGRTILRAYFESNSLFINEIVVNSTSCMKDSLHFFCYDSTFGIFKDEIIIKSETSCMINGVLITFISQRDHSLISWKDLAVDVVMECTGKFLTKESLEIHVKNGAKKVILSAPSKSDDVKMAVFGVNNDVVKDEDIFSIGSCTTNCLAPVIKALKSKFTIISGFATTIHAYTSDQNLLDNSHKDKRRARSAAMSIVPTSSGVSKALGVIFPDLMGKIDGSAIRVPVNNVSVVDLTINIKEDVNSDKVNDCFLGLRESMNGVFAVSQKPLVSIDFNKRKESCIVDLLETRVVNNSCVRVLAWYDNEWGFSNRMLDFGLCLSKDI